MAVRPPPCPPVYFCLQFLLCFRSRFAATGILRTATVNCQNCGAAGTGVCLHYGNSRGNAHAHTHGKALSPSCRGQRHRVDSLALDDVSQLRALRRIVLRRSMQHYQEYYTMSGIYKKN
jgi:hypothetical protein